MLTRRTPPHYTHPRPTPIKWASNTKAGRQASQAPPAACVRPRLDSTHSRLTALICVDRPQMALCCGSRATKTKRTKSVATCETLAEDKWNTTARDQVGHDRDRGAREHASRAHRAAETVQQHVKEQNGCVADISFLQQRSAGPQPADRDGAKGSRENGVGRNHAIVGFPPMAWQVRGAPTLVIIGPTLARLRPSSGRSRTSAVGAKQMPVEIGPNLAEVRPKSTEFGATWTELCVS